MNYAKMAYVAYRGVKTLRGLVNVEKKYIDDNIGQTIPNTGIVDLISAVAAGDDVTNRNGNSILAKYLVLKGFVRMSASATATNVRVMIVRDLNNQGSNPTVADILDGATDVSLLNKDNTSRFWILYDKMFSLSNNGTQQVSLDIYRRLNFHLKYSSTVSTAVLSNAIYLVAIADEPTNVPQIQGVSRIAFYDN